MPDISLRAISSREKREVPGMTEKKEELEKKQKKEKGKEKTIVHVKPLENPAIEMKSRRNGLQVKEELKAEEELILARENIWETPPFLRRKMVSG
jgi:hypothetical protein